MQELKQLPVTVVYELMDAMIDGTEKIRERFVLDDGSSEEPEDFT